MLTLADGARYRTRLLVAADGVTPSCASTSRYRSVADYGQSAVIAAVQDGQGSRRAGLPSVSPTGAAGPAAMQGTGYPPGLERPAGRGAGVDGLDDAAFLARLQQAFGWRLGRFRRTGRVTSTLVLTVADYPWPSAHRAGGQCRPSAAPHRRSGASSLGMRDLDLLTRGGPGASRRGGTSAASRC